jgi:hypothetical protein
MAVIVVIQAVIQLYGTFLSDIQPSTTKMFSGFGYLFTHVTL